MQTTWPRRADGRLCGLHAVTREVWIQRPVCGTSAEIHRDLRTQRPVCTTGAATTSARMHNERRPQASNHMNATNECSPLRLCAFGLLSGAGSAVSRCPAHRRAKGRRSQASNNVSATIKAHARTPEHQPHPNRVRQISLGRGPLPSLSPGQRRSGGGLSTPGGRPRCGPTITQFQ